MNRPHPSLICVLASTTLAAACTQLSGIEGLSFVAGTGGIGDASAEGGTSGSSGSGEDASTEADALLSCDGGAQPMGVLGEPCCKTAELACAGHAQKLVLICDSKSHTWAALQSCSGMQLCDSSVGMNQGSCQDPVAICIGAQPGDKVCDGANAVECGPDLVTSTESNCANACNNGACVGQCVPGTRQCNAATPQWCDSSGNWQSEPPCAYVCKGEGKCSGVCTPGGKQCSGDTRQSCDTDGQWKDLETCPLVCTAEKCESTCTSNAAQCSGKVRQVCANGAWEDAEVCAYACSNGACTGSCPPESKQCSGQIPQGCDAQGAWHDGTSCPYVCTAGMCSGVCTPGDKNCNGLTPRSCSDAGQWQSTTACAYVCSSGVCSGVCTPGGQRCNGQVPQSCNAAGQWEDGSACTYVCTAGTCAGACGPGDAQCNGGVRQVCNSLGGWDDAQTCPWVCQNGTCAGSCAPGTTRCSSQIPQSCDANGVWQGAVACPFVCSAGVCTGACAPGSKQCSSSVPQTCDASGQWSNAAACSGSTPVCSAGECLAPSSGGPSCAGLAENCGASGSTSCCASSVVDGGTFHRSNNTTYPATVSTFRLDQFEVTVGRFRKFVAAWIGGWRPAAGAGKHAHLNGGAGLARTDGGYEAGWDTSWSAALATTASGWNYNLMKDATIQSWTPSAGSKENRPINYATWMELYAFCIWDGGFLPSEAELSYAAAGGNEQRQYPWSSPPSSTTIDCNHANYEACAGNLDNVGMRAPLGDGRWGQSDLAGNIFEWTLDWFASPYKNPCTDCLNLVLGSYRSMCGGAFWTAASLLLVAHRDGGTPSHRNGDYGARCARVP